MKTTPPKVSLVKLARWFAGATLGCVVGLSTFAAGINDGFVGYYRLDGDALDSSGNGYNGVNTGVAFQQGRFGSAAVYDGNSAKHIRVDDFPQIQSNLTVSVWFKPNGYFGEYPGNSLVTRGTNNEAFGFWVGPGSAHVDMNGGAAQPLSFHTSASVNSDSAFDHAAFVYDYAQGKLRMFLDGQLLAERAYASAIYSGTVGSSHGSIPLRGRRDAISVRGGIDGSSPLVSTPLILSEFLLPNR